MDWTRKQRAIFSRPLMRQGRGRSVLKTCAPRCVIFTLAHANLFRSRMKTT
ncbi:MAG: hypothetical protein MJE68_32765 [Proteobacteria bacterium]|nr:hypothetical protein [Pseudomonadota bacterium]